MKIYCDRCKNEIHALSSHCFYCGAVAPAKTIVGDFTEAVFKNGIFCPACGRQCPEDAAFCGFCADSLFKKPLDSRVYCPLCGEKNNADALSCMRCRGIFDDWFSMRGAAAQKLGFKGNLGIKEKMTGISYYFINGPEKSEIRIGRKPENDIVIPCDWVSSNHCRLDLEKKKLIDEGSANGSYINRRSEPVRAVNFSEIDEFNVAGSFTFNVVKKSNLFIFRLMAILDEEDCNKNGDPDAYDILRNNYYILLAGDQEIFIRKQDGYIDEEKKPFQDYYTVKFENGFYYYSDPLRDIREQLLFNKAANWPVNWFVKSGGAVDTRHTAQDSQT